MIRWLMLFHILVIGKPGICQESIRINLGVNVSNVKHFVIIDDLKSDTTFNYRKNLTLPNICIYKYFKVKDKLNLAFGLGVGWYGARDFNLNIPPRFNIDRNLKIGALQFPIEFEVELIKNLNLSGGYKLCYPFRKNVNFSVFDSNNHEIPIYKPLHHFLSFGVSKSLGNLVLELKYDVQINKIFDSKNYLIDSRGFAKIKNFNCGLAWIIT